MTAKAFRFRLYVVGGQVGSLKAEPDLRQVLDSLVPGAYELEVVDLLARPDLAKADEVAIAPTVVRLEPQPLRRAMGSLADAAKVAAALDLPVP